MGFELRQPPSKQEAANEFVERMKDGVEEACSALGKAKEDMARYYDQCRLLTPNYMPGEKVYLNARDIKTM